MADWILTRVKWAFKNKTFSLYVQERKFVGGSMQLSTKMAEVLGDRVHLNEPVIRVEQSDDGVTVTTSTGNVYKVSMINHNVS